MECRVRVVQLSGKLLGEVELPETASVADILAAIQHGGTLDPTLKRNLVLEGRALEESELLRDLDLPRQSSPTEMQEILQPQRLLRMPPSSLPSRRIHIGVLGKQGVGKTSLVCRYANTDPFAAVARRIDFAVAHAMAAGMPVKIILWDRAGPRSSRFEVPDQFRGKHALLFVVDLTDPKSLEALAPLLALPQTQAVGTKLLIGTKADLTIYRRIQRQEAECYAEAEGLTYFETSAHDDVGISVVGMKALCDCLEERAGVLTCGGEEDAGKDREDVMKTFLPELEPPAKEVVAVVCGADFAFNYYKLAKAANYLRQNPGALFVATNPDPRALMAPGTFFPAAGSMWSAIAVAAGRQPDIVCGKPSETLARYLLSSKGLSPDTTCMVGDRTDTDIAFGRSVGMQTLFVASGSMTEQEVMQANSTDQPHYVADSIAILGQLLKPEK
ncbi:PGLP2 [Symbiodinium sp. KB8]|nr:PGLP2 [Symbiodinium sp. KB8]